MTTIKRNLVSASFVCILALSLEISGEQVCHQTDVEEIVTEIKRIIDDKMFEDITKAERDQIKELRTQLVQAGENAVQFIEYAIYEETDAVLRRQLTAALGEISGEQSDRALMRLLCFDKELFTLAGSQLVRRTERNGPFTFRIPDEEIQEIIARIESEHVFVIGDLVRILAMCKKNPVEPRYRIILNRFLKELQEPSELHVVPGAYTSPGVFVLNKFLLAFKHMGSVIRPYLRQEAAQAREHDDEETEKWLKIALGITGDPGVVSYLKDVAYNDPDPYTRCEAIRAYALSAGRSAIPLLRELLHDRTVSEYLPDHHAGKYFIAVIARGYLANLIKEDLYESEYMRAIDDLLLDYTLNKDELFTVGSRKISEFLSYGHNLRELPKTNKVHAAFRENNLDYITHYIVSRRKANHKDIFALLLEFDLRLSYNDFKEAVNILDAALKIITSENNPCPQYSTAIIYSMVFAYESKVRDYHIDPTKDVADEAAPTMTCLYIAYMLEANGCL